MALAGLDHVVIAVTDLDRAARDWAALGFTLSPRGVHSTHMGTINHTVMLGPDYIELLAVAQPTDGNKPTRAFLERNGEGIERLAIRTTDAAADAIAARAGGRAAIGPVSFGRPVELADGQRLDAAFSVFYWPDEARVAEMRLFACQHHTPGAVWLPALMRHDNGARRLLRLERAVGDPESAAHALGGLLGIAPQELGTEEGGRWRIATAPGRADIDFIEPAAVLANGAARLVLASDDRTTTRRDPWCGNGISLVFESERR
jgi:hypothetical protein